MECTRLRVESTPTELTVQLLCQTTICYATCTIEGVPIQSSESGEERRGGGGGHMSSEAAVYS